MSQELISGTPLQGGRYVITQVLGQGGFGITYLAEQVSLVSKVAIKEFFMRDYCERDSLTGKVTTSNSIQVGRYHAKFLKEARTLSTLNHPNIISIFDVFEENGTAYYVMPFMPNGSLNDLVRKNGRLKEDVAWHYIRQIAQALKYMHENNFCHYDVKPSNIMLDRYNNAILIDFGISKNYDVNGQETTTTPIAISAGFAPIEQYEGRVSKFSPASDVYALGATLYYLVMGKAPLTAIDLSTGGTLRFDSNVSPVTQDIIRKSMIKDPNKRPKDVDEFISVEPAAVHPPTTVHRVVPKPPPKPIWGNIYRFVKKLLTTLLWGAFLGAIIIGMLYWINHNKGMKLPYDPIERLEADMVYVAGGSFMMGATAEQIDDANDVEEPVRKAFVGDFYICKYEVTQGLWQAIMDYNPSHNQGIMLNLFKGDLERPVECISWEACQEFVVKLSELTGNHYRLPTEIEWEYAARGGNRSDRYKYSGSNYIYEVAWYSLNSQGDTHTVGTKHENELGLYDMSGNVAEWCQDKTGSNGYEHIMRGGDKNDDATDCRVSVSKRSDGSFSQSDCGLRLVADAPFKKNPSKEISPSWWQKHFPQWLSECIEWIYK